MSRQKADSISKEKIFLYINFHILEPKVSFSVVRNSYNGSAYIATSDQEIVANSSAGSGFCSFWFLNQCENQAFSEYFIEAVISTLSS